MSRCDATCCHGGVYADPVEKERILAHAELIKAHMEPDQQHDTAQWFDDEVVDDIDFSVSHVIRGEDHLSNTAKHIALFKAFGVEPPKYAHIPLILNPDGSKMSKRASVTTAPSALLVMR